MTTKGATTDALLEQTNLAIEAIHEKRLKTLAENLHNDKNHLLHKLCNKYPAIPFAITRDDLQVITTLLDSEYSVPKDHEWTPLEKIFWAHLWKDAKLKSIKRIIEGVECAVNNQNSVSDKAVVYHYFGRHLTDRLKEPIIDQHTYRAFRLLTRDSDDDLVQIRAIEKLTNKDADEYCKWYRNILRAEGIKSYDKSRKIDSYLFALGKYAKVKT